MTAAAALVAFVLRGPVLRGPAPITGASITVEVPTSTTICRVITARELHHRGDHAVLCIDAAGGIVGMVLRPAGRVRCPVSGTVGADGCTTVEACGQTARGC